MKAYMSKLVKRILSAGKGRELMDAYHNKKPFFFEGKWYTVKLHQRNYD